MLSKLSRKNINHEILCSVTGVGDFTAYLVTAALLFYWLNLILVLLAIILVLTPSKMRAFSALIIFCFLMYFLGWQRFFLLIMLFFLLYYLPKYLLGSIAYFRRLKTASRFDKTKIRKILVGRSHGIGDDIMTLPLIDLLRREFPQTKISVICRPATMDIYKNNPSIDEIIIDELDQPLNNRPKRNPLTLFNFAKKIRGRKFDLYVSTWANKTHALLGYLSGIPYRIGDLGTYRYGWIFNLGTHRKFYRFNLHYIEQNLILLKNVIKDTSPYVPSLSVYYNDESFLKELYKKHKINNDDTLIAFSSGTSGANKFWPAETQIELIKLLQTDPKNKLILLAGPEHASLAEAMTSQLKDRLINLAGQTSIGQLISILRKCQLHICFDSGPMHLGAALKIPTAAIFLSKSQLPTHWGPWGTPQIILKNLSSKCPLNCSSPSCKLSLCLNDISSQDAYNASLKLLHGEGLKTEEEIRNNWSRLSFSIAVLSDQRQKHDSRAEQIERNLTSNGYKAEAIQLTNNFHHDLCCLIRTIRKEHINIIHLSGRNTIYREILVTCLKVIFKTEFIVARDQTNLVSPKDLINYYKEIFTSL